MENIKKQVRTFFKQQADLFCDEFYLEDNIQDLIKQKTGLDGIKEEVKNCNQCPALRRRKNIVFGAGNPEADLMMIDMISHEDEEAEGTPLVGEAGKLFDKILAAINLSRDDIYLTKIIKCPISNNRQPSHQEIVNCLKYLYRQIDIIKPKLMVGLGLKTAKALINQNQPLEKIHGHVYKFHAIDFITTYHPKALIKNQSFKKPAWDDFKKIRELYLKHRN